MEASDAALLGVVGVAVAVVIAAVAAASLLGLDGSAYRPVVLLATEPFAWVVVAALVVAAVGNAYIG